ncbi:MAG: trypsin-like peptidase domain-containing protein [Deltaproteobacteria bacterium]|nr:trypsin-like peptidase domain-containing protein [Deltaproteobacteria bacterium]
MPRPRNSAFLALAWTLALAAVSCRPAQEERGAAQPSAAAPQPSPEVKVIYPNVPGSFVNVVKSVRPSVVNVFAAQIVRNGPLFGWPGFEDILGMPRQERIQRSLGSGFIIDGQGFILTNFHVVRGASEILVQLEDGREAPAMPVGADSNIDTALLHVEERNLTPVKLGDSDKLEVGEWVLAIGNPLGLSNTVTAGIVSAKGRDYGDMGIARHGFQSFIQTDASINPGNSGGPLMNVEGEVVGINTAIAPQGQGIGFAVPINMVKSILPQLRRTGHVVPAWLGVAIRDLLPEIRDRLASPDGVLVTAVYENGPAVSADLKPGDVITGFNGSSVSAASELGWLATTAGVGNEARIAVFRGGKTFETKLVLAPKPYGAP